MRAGDLEPAWIVDIVADTDTDFTQVVSWRFDAYRETTNGKVAAFSVAADHEAGTNPWLVSVSHTWTAGQTDVPGILHGVPVAVWPGGREQSFPGASIDITPAAS